MRTMSNSSTTTNPVEGERIPLPTPGDILLKEFLEPAGLTQYALAKALNVPPIRISEIIRGKRVITADTALRLSTYWGNSPQFWLNLQTSYDLEKAQEDLADTLRGITPRAA